MCAFPEAGLVDPASAWGFAMIGRPVPDADRRVVAVASNAVELLRPESDLARLLESFGRADVLLAAEDIDEWDDGDEDDGDPDGWTSDGEGGDESGNDVRAAAAALGHPDLVVHRLGLRMPLAADDEGELVAALSELVGFDPEDGVYCLAPADPAGDVVSRAAQRIAQVYGLPLLRYRCMELSVVDPIVDAGPRIDAAG